ncbi:MAG TPA: DMT family transporter [Longimicrobiales bacterium]
MNRQNLMTATAATPVRRTRDRPLPPGLVLAVAVFALGWAGPLVRFATAPALVIAAWRLLFSVAAIAIVLTARRGWGELARLDRRAWLLALASGALLALHFWSWITSLRWTSVASSVVLVNTQPVFVATLSAFALGERASRRQWLGIAVAVTGAVIIGWGDFGRGASPLIGDLLAVAGAVFAAGYYVIGRNLRQRLDLWTYIGLVYGVAAALLTAAVIFDPTAALTGYPESDWVVFIALAAGPMMIGHTGVNYALRYLPAYVANLATLGEPVGATIIAWALPAIAERPTVQVVVGGVSIGVGIGIGLRGRRSGDV